MEGGISCCGSGTAMIAEGTVLSPRTAPALGAIVMYYLFGGYRILGEAAAAGVKPPCAFIL